MGISQYVCVCVYVYTYNSLKLISLIIYIWKTFLIVNKLNDKFSPMKIEIRYEDFLEKHKLL